MLNDNRWISLGILAMLFALIWPSPVAAQDEARVRAILFYSPTCPHCHIVMTEVIPPLQAEYGQRLRVLEVDTSTAEGNALWQATVTRYQPELVGVPTLVVGDELLIGSREIPDRFPGLIEAGLSAGGIEWPDLPGLEALVGTEVDPSSQQMTLVERFTRDLAGNTLSVFVLVVLVAALVAVMKPRPWLTEAAERFSPWGMLVAIAVGMIAATYLSYVETTGTEAVCGPVGDCNTVQQSEFAVLFGFLPVAVLGVLGYLAILVAHVYATWIKGPWSDVVAPAVVFMMALFGLALSVFLTFLEPFVIGATCAWCLTSAVSMMFIAVLSAGPGWTAMRTMFERQPSPAR
ncbi:MAG: vitamin K epoxide reductase family protein [Anaerolineae bacterium]